MRLTATNTLYLILFRELFNYVRYKSQSNLEHFYNLFSINIFYLSLILRRNCYNYIIELP